MWLGYRKRWAVSGELLALAVVVGLGTWAFRYLPLWWRTSPPARRRPLPGSGGSGVGEGRGGDGEPSADAAAGGAHSTSPGSPGKPDLAGRFLAGIGVAAVAALAASSLRPYLSEVLSATGLPWETAVGPEAGPPGGASAGASVSAWRSALALAAGLAATVSAFLPLRSVAAATVLGAAAYGLTSWLLGVAS